MLRWWFARVSDVARAFHCAFAWMCGWCSGFRFRFVWSIVHIVCCYTLHVVNCSLWCHCQFVSRVCAHAIVGSMQMLCRLFCRVAMCVRWLFVVFFVDTTTDTLSQEHYLCCTNLLVWHNVEVGEAAQLLSPCVCLCTFGSTASSQCLLGPFHMFGLKHVFLTS